MISGFAGNWTDAMRIKVEFPVSWFQKKIKLSRDTDDFALDFYVDYFMKLL